MTVPIREIRAAIDALEALAARGQNSYTQDPQPVTPVSTSMDTNTHGLSDPTQAEVQAFTDAWGIEAQRQKVAGGEFPKGTKTRAGLRAAYAARKQRLADAHAESVERSKYEHEERLQQIRFALDSIKATIKPRGLQYVTALSRLIEEMATDVATLQATNASLRQVNENRRKTIQELLDERQEVQEQPASEEVQEQPSNGLYDQRLHHLNRIANVVSTEGPAAQSIEWMRTSLAIEHNRGGQPTPSVLDLNENPEASALDLGLLLDPAPWRITKGGSTSTDVGDRFQDADTIPMGARFRFSPRTGYEQAAGLYPRETYGEGMSAVYPQPAPSTLDPTPWLITRGSTASGMAEGSRFTDGDTYLKGATFRFDPRAQYEQDPSQYPSETYGKWIKVTRGPALATTEQDITDEDIYAERQNQISRGYSARHDDEHGLRHLLLMAILYGKKHKSVESLALIRAALESMARQGKDL